MATVNADLPTMLDFIKSRDPNGAQAKVVEMLSRRNTALKDAVVKEGNLTTGHRVTMRFALPAVGSGLAWRKYNEGVAPGKSRTDQVDEACGKLSGMSKVDVSLAKLNGDAAAFRASQDMGFLEAIHQEVETGIFYHSTKTAPEKFMGLSPRLDVSAGNVAASQIIKHTGSPSGSDQATIWGVVWGDDSAYLIFPKASLGGLQHRDMGEQVAKDANNAEFPAYYTWWEWDIGLCIEDWRQIVRGCNIDTSALSATADDLCPLMLDMYYQLQAPEKGRLVWYCNRFIQKMLHKQARATVKPSTLTIEKIEGQEITTFMGAPVRLTDALLNTEAVVS